MICIDITLPPIIGGVSLISVDFQHPSPPRPPNTRPGTPCMAKAIGEANTSEVGPIAGPRWHLLKQMAPVKAREYYNTKVPSTTICKPKAPSCCLSMKPGNQPESPTEMNSYTPNIDSQEPKGVIMERPIMLISNTPPLTETTPHAQCITHMLDYTNVDENMVPKTPNINRAISAAAEHNLDYHKINKMLAQCTSRH